MIATRRMNQRRLPAFRALPLLVAVTAAAAPAGCSSDTGCQDDLDCPATAVCIDHRCVVLEPDGGPHADAGQDAGVDTDDGCQPATCAELGHACGSFDDGCGGTLDCGTCGAGEMCDQGQCVCAPADCASLGHECGSFDDGCGGTLDCGGCPAGHACDQGQCVCVPADCASLGHECGNWDDGCGGALDCGTCPAGEVCDQGQCREQNVDCSGIDAQPAFELCESSPDHCAGVYTNGAGCIAYCAAAGLVCTARFGGEPGCQKEPDYPIDCNENNDHLSDWCACGRGGSDPDCEIDPGDPPVLAEQHYRQAVFDPRSSWVLDCRDYAYTARFDEHTACDSQYVPGSGRGSATFTFDVPRGLYDVYIEGRHTENRNPDGARVVVTSNGQTHVVYIMQRDDAGIVMDLHGRYCLDGNVTVVIDSTVSSASDSVRRVRLAPAP